MPRGKSIVQLLRDHNVQPTPTTTPTPFHLQNACKFDAFPLLPRLLYLLIEFYCGCRYLPLLSYHYVYCSHCSLKLIFMRCDLIDFFEKLRLLFIENAAEIGITCISCPYLSVYLRVHLYPKQFRWVDSGLEPSETD